MGKFSIVNKDGSFRDTSALVPDGDERYGDDAGGDGGGYNGGDDGGSSSMPNGIAERVAVLEEKLNHMPTNWVLVGIAAAVVAAIVGPLLAVMFHLNNGMRSDIQSMGGDIKQETQLVRSDAAALSTKLDKIDDRVRNIEIDASALKANSATNTADLQLIRQKIEPKPR